MRGETNTPPLSPLEGSNGGLRCEIEERVAKSEGWGGQFQCIVWLRGGRSSLGAGCSEF